MRSFTLFVWILVVALAPCIFADEDEIPLINPEAHDQAAELLNEMFPTWEYDVDYDDSLLPEYERAQHVLEEAYMERPVLQATSRLYTALESRFNGQGAPFTRTDVLAAITSEYDGLEPYHVSAVSNAVLAAEEDEEFTDEVARATANMLMEGLGFPVPQGEESYSVMDFEPHERIALHCMTLFKQ